MPKVVKTVRSNSSTHSTTEFAMNVVESVASALGSSYVRSDDESNPDIREYYILTDSIGYPGFCLVLSYTNFTQSSIKLNVYIKTTASNAPDGSDSYAISAITDPINSVLIDYNPATCVLFKDSSNDTVAFSVLSGSTEDGSDVIAAQSTTFTFKAFFAKDMNNDVLCGIGDSHIHALRTKTNRMDSNTINSTSKPETKNIGLPNCLHLTKMVNYLSPDYTEMKSAYISVVRPSSIGSMYNRSYYADNARWGFSGFWDEVPKNSNDHVFIKAFSPFVKY